MWLLGLVVVYLGLVIASLALTSWAIYSCTFGRKPKVNLWFLVRIAGSIALAIINLHLGWQEQYQAQQTFGAILLISTVWLIVAAFVGDRQKRYYRHH